MKMKNWFVGFCFGASALSPMAPYALHAEDTIDIEAHQMTITTDIDSTIDEVWREMVDFNSYERWNPWYRVEGKAQEGAVVKAISGDQHLDLEITKVDENMLCWVDVSWFTHLGMGGWRCRIVWPNPNGRGVKFTNHFEFTGPFRFVLERGAKEMLVEGMLQENRGLKAFVERR